jgi:hypothetical protein
MVVEHHRHGSALNGISNKAPAIILVAGVGQKNIARLNATAV